jgi:hypothetical protein
VNREDQKRDEEKIPAGDVFNVWYRSLTPDGKVWCESRDPKEVVVMSAGKGCRFEKLTTYIVHGDWEPWSADDHSGEQQ